MTPMLKERLLAIRLSKCLLGQLDQIVSHSLASRGPNEAAVYVLSWTNTPQDTAIERPHQRL